MRYLTLVAILTLCACGGGGGGGGGGTPTTTPNDVIGVPIPSTFQGPSDTQTYGLATATGSILNNTFSGADTLQSSGASGATVTLVTNERNEVTQFTLTAPGLNETFTVDDVVPIADTLSHGDLATALRRIDQGEIIVGTDVLSYSAFGVWASTDGDITNVTAAVFATGRETPLASMPLTGAATYNGRTIGVGGTPQLLTAFTFGGNAAVTANFAAGTVTTAFTGLQTQGISSGANGALPDINGAGLITGNSFGSALASNGFTGNAIGRFYGPAAEEVAGVWRAANGAAFNPATVSLMGSFAAAR
jgi:hypothetical protein